MLYKWLFELSDVVSGFNVFRYITFRSFLSFLTAFLFCWFFAPVLIRKLNKRNIREEINTDGPKTHQRKKGTPTMGGGLIILSLLVSSILWVDMSEPLVWGVLAMLLAFAAIGFWDDLLKSQRKNFRGIPRRYRLLYEFLVAGVLLTVFIAMGYIEPVLYVPFFKDLSFNLSWFYVLFGSFVIVGTANAVNLTDGLDGLAIVPVMVCAGTLAIFTYIAGHFNVASYLGIPYVAGAGEIMPLAMAVVAGGLGFLWYNSYPAQIFMGDVGSLSLGAFVGTVAVFTKNDLLLSILGGVFVAEALSVILQILSFKLFKRRVFAMAPLHHHFELKGMDESKIIIRFWIMSFLLAVISLATLKLR